MASSLQPLSVQDHQGSGWVAAPWTSSGQWMGSSALGHQGIELLGHHQIVIGFE